MIKEATEAGRNQTFLERICQTPFIGQDLGGTNTLRFLVVLNIFIAITAVVSGNTLILAALYKLSSLHHLPSKIFLRSLALSDIWVGLLSDPLFIVYLITVELENWNDLCHRIITTTVAASQVLSSMPLFTLSAIIVDRPLPSYWA